MQVHLSIVMPVLNEAAAIAPALRSAARFRALGAELIVVDGGSSDATAALCTGAADRVVQSAPGRARQMNAGARAASGSVLLFLHADTVLPDDAAALIAACLRNPRRSWGRFDVHIAGRSAMFPLIGGLMNLRSRLTGIATGDQAIFVRRDLFQAVGGFPEQPLMEDIELSGRLRRLGWPACLRAKVTTSGRRWERYGVWPTIWLMWRLRLLYWLGVPAARLAAAYR